jgi:hypothetical protein
MMTSVTALTLTALGTSGARGTAALLLLWLAWLLVFALGLGRGIVTLRRGTLDGSALLLGFLARELFGFTLR